MNKTTSPQPDSSEERPREVALESWKEIAAYLKRDVRTVSRWERDERLPIHRHQHQARSSVYAYPSELEAWKAARQPEKETSAEPLWRRAARVAALAAGFLMAFLSISSGPIRQLEAAGADAASSGIVVRQVWAGPEVDALGAPSADGRLLPFVDWNTGDLAIRDLTTGTSRHLTDKGPWFKSPQFAVRSRLSPDGKQIAYTWYTDSHTDAQYELRLIGVDGSGAKVLGNNPEIDYYDPRDWSPDGKTILTLLFRKEHVNQIALISAADGSAKILKTLDWRAPLNVAFSPNGRYIAYDFPPQEDSENRDIFLLASDGSREAPLVQHPANDFLLGWAPHHEGVLFASDRTGAFDAWLINAEEGKPAGPARLVKQGVGRMIPMGFTRDGSYYYGVQSGNNEVYLATLDPGTGTVLAPPSPVAHRFMGTNSSPAFSPDGRYLAYVSRRTPIPSAWGPIVITIRSLEDETERELKLNEIVGVGLTAWSPDGRSIAFGGYDRKGRQGLYQVDVGSGAVTPIVRSGPDESRWLLRWAPDGRTIYCGHHKNKFMRVSVEARDTESGHETELIHVDRPSMTQNLAISPDGLQVAVALETEGQRTGCLKLIPTAGSEPRKLYCPDESKTIFPGTVTWAPDGQHILFGLRNAEGDLAHHQTVEMWQIPAGGGQPQKLGLAMDTLRFLALHPDGRRVAFQAGESAAEVWVMENFLPKLQAEGASGGQ